MTTATPEEPWAVKIDHVATSDRGLFSSKLRIAAPAVVMRPDRSGAFRADAYIASMKRLGLFTVRLQDVRATRGPSTYTAVTIPVVKPLDFYRGREHQTFHPGSAHVLHTHDSLDLRVGPASGMFVATFDGEWIDHSAWRLTHRERYGDLLAGWHLDLNSSTGQSFRHFLDFIWAETCRGGKFTRSEVAAREIENTCATLLILASESELHRQMEERRPALGKSAVEMAEEYLRGHIDEPFALDKLIEITGTSASTLLRDFRKRYGMPPLQYLKNCRLEAARAELESADPGETSVTDVAMRYGFYHLGRFAGYYRETFGELPSRTLSRAH